MFHRKRRHSSSGHSLAVEDSVTFILLATLLALAPWIRGGNRQIAMLVLLGIALLLLANLAAQFSYQLIKPRLQPFANNAVGQLSAMSALRLPRWKWVLIFLLATSPQWLGLVQLVPIPVEWWAHLPGRQPYLAAQQAAGIVTPASLPLSLNPLATQASILASIPVAAVFLASVLLPAHKVYPLIKLLLVMGLAQVVLSVAQFATGGAQSPLLFTNYAGGAIQGSFANRNSLADYLAMMVPLWFVVQLHLDRHGHSKRHGDGGPFQGMLKPLWALCGFALLVTLVTTQSRGGLLASLVAMSLSLWVYLATRNRYELSFKAKAGIALGMVAFATVALIAAGADKITSRIQRQQLALDTDARQTLALSTFEGSQTLWPWGGGMGTFESVFPRFQHLHSVFSYVNEAHNDYAQLLMDLGWGAVLVAVLVIVLTGHQIRQLLSAVKADRRLSTTVAVQWLAGVSALALMLHSWVDFNMRIPALAMTASFLAGVFLRDPGDTPTARHG
jgi:hypothetical protein